MKVKVRKHKKAPAPVEAEQVQKVSQHVKYVSIDLRKIIENAKKKTT